MLRGRSYFAPPKTGAIRLFALRRLQGVVEGRLRRCAAAHAVFHAIAYAAVGRQYAIEIEASSLFSPFYIAVFGHSASLCRLHSTSILGSLRCLYASSFGHFPSSFAHFRPSISSIFDAILPQIIRLVLPRRLQRLPRPLLPLRLLPPLLSGEKNMAARPSGEGRPKEGLTRSAYASLPPPLVASSVGGRFCHFLQVWTEVDASQSVLVFVRGFVIPFAHPPRLSLPTPASFVNFSRPDHVTLIDAEVEALQGGAIEEVFPSSPGYFSRLFLVPKPVGWRPIINLVRLNSLYIICPPPSSAWTR